ncbi:MAG: nucleoside triphosphate pyrophosphatase [Halioglobus sp.]|nr:nucleoside triphosphate pyrophosphatase [Halioglobus sp.]
MDIILASTSPYRENLLQRLRLPFRCEAPGVEEATLDGETPAQMAQRLARAKAASISARHPTALVIGSDQVAALDGDVLGKPGTRETAQQQLRRCSGKSVVFFTGLAVMRAAQPFQRLHLATTTAVFRDLDGQEIDRYLEADQPYDCAGSFKVESLGITLFSELRGSDPTSLEGLPLIALGAALRDAGIDLP